MVSVDVKPIVSLYSVSQCFNFSNGPSSRELYQCVMIRRQEKSISPSVGACRPNFIFKCFDIIALKSLLVFVSWCFEPSQPLGILSGLKTNSKPSLSYSAHKPSKANKNISTAQLFQTYTHIHKITHISTKPQLFCITVKMFQLKYFSTRNLL